MVGPRGPGLAAPLVTLTAVTTTLGCLICLNGEATSRFAQRAVGKILASCSFVAAGWFAGLPSTPHGEWGMIALGFGLLGDLALLSDRRRVFLAGLVAFLAGHLAYARALADLAPNLPAAAVAFVVMAGVGVAIVRWTAPGAGKLAPAVAVYALAIASMVALAVGVAFAAPATPTVVLALAAVLFAASDVAVARQRFVEPALINRAVGLPLYYLAQLLFVWGLARV